MPLPNPIAKPILSFIYKMMMRLQDKTIQQITRTVQHVDEKQRASFDHLFDSALQTGPNTLIAYDLPYPKSDFLNYLCDWRGYVVHGSPLRDLDVLQPLRKSKDTTEFGNRQQIFASPDAMWAMWFAIFDKNKVELTNNACIRSGTGLGRTKYYHFGLPKNRKEEHPFTDGALYVTHATDFPDKRYIPILYHLNAEIEEWGSSNPVTPLVRIHVTPDDFPYLGNVHFAS